MGGLADLLPRWSPEATPFPSHGFVRREVRRAALSLQWQALEQALLSIGSDDERHFCLELAIEALSGLHQEFSQIGVPTELSGVGVILFGILLAGDPEAVTPELHDAIDRGLRSAPAAYRSLSSSLLLWSGALRRLDPAALWLHAGTDRSGSGISARVLSHAMAVLDGADALPVGELVSLSQHWTHDSPEGTDLPMLLLEAHVRHQRRLASINEGLGLLYFVEESVQFDVVESLKRGIQSTRYTETPWTDRWRSLAAYALYLMGDYRRAREHFNALERVPELAPWCFLGANAQDQYDHAKEIVCRGR